MHAAASIAAIEKTTRRLQQLQFPAVLVGCDGRDGHFIVLVHLDLLHAIAVTGAAQVAVERLTVFALGLILVIGIGLSVSVLLDQQGPFDTTALAICRWRF